MQRKDKDGGPLFRSAYSELGGHKFAIESRAQHLREISALD